MDQSPIIFELTSHLDLKLLKLKRSLNLTTLQSEETARQKNEKRFHERDQFEIETRSNSEDGRDKNEIEVVAIHQLYQKILKRNGTNMTTSKGIFSNLMNSLNPTNLPKKAIGQIGTSGSNPQIQPLVKTIAGSSKNSSGLVSTAIFNLMSKTQTLLLAASGGKEALMNGKHLNLTSTQIQTPKISLGPPPTSSLEVKKNQLLLSSVTHAPTYISPQASVVPPILSQGDSKQQSNSKKRLKKENNGGANLPPIMTTKQPTVGENGPKDGKIRKVEIKLNNNREGSGNKRLNQDLTAAGGGVG